MKLFFIFLLTFLSINCFCMEKEGPSIVQWAYDIHLGHTDFIMPECPVCEFIGMVSESNGDGGRRFHEIRDRKFRIRSQEYMANPYQEESELPSIRVINEFSEYSLGLIIMLLTCVYDFGLDKTKLLHVLYHDELIAQKYLEIAKLILFHEYKLEGLCWIDTEALRRALIFKLIKDLPPGASICGYGKILMENGYEIPESFGHV